MEFHGIWVRWHLLLSASSTKSCQSVSVSWPTIGSPFPTYPPIWSWKSKNNSNVSSGQPALFLLKTSSSVRLCARVAGATCAIQRQRRRSVCVHIHIHYVRSLDGVQLRGTCSSAGCCDVILPPLHCVFTPAWVTALQLSSRGGVCCMCARRAKWEVFWSRILSVPLPFQTYLKVQRKALIAWSFWQAAPMLILLPLYHIQRRNNTYICSIFISSSLLISSSYCTACIVTTQIPTGQTCIAPCSWGKTEQVMNCGERFHHLSLQSFCIGKRNPYIYIFLQVLPFFLYLLKVRGKLREEKKTWVTVLLLFI